jgi:hypothetical protein
VRDLLGSQRELSLFTDSSLIADALAAPGREGEREGGFRAGRHLRATRSARVGHRARAGLDRRTRTRRSRAHPPSFPSRVRAGGEGPVESGQCRHPGSHPDVRRTAARHDAGDARWHPRRVNPRTLASAAPPPSSAVEEPSERPFGRGSPRLALGQAPRAAIASKCSKSRESPELSRAWRACAAT